VEKMACFLKIFLTSHRREIEMDATKVFDDLTWTMW